MVDHRPNHLPQRRLHHPLTHTGRPGAAEPPSGARHFPRHSAHGDLTPAESALKLTRQTKPHSDWTTKRVPPLFRIDLRYRDLDLKLQKQGRSLRADSCGPKRTDP